MAQGLPGGALAGWAALAGNTVLRLRLEVMRMRATMCMQRRHNGAVAGRLVGAPTPLLVLGHEMAWDTQRYKNTVANTVLVPRWRSPRWGASLLQRGSASP